ncbi:MAG: molybdopterin-dependent oxidoreductase [Desulfobacterium sp.]
MSEWKKTSCALCPQNCGLEMEIENNRILKVKGDKDNPRSQGYICVKGSNISWTQHHADRLSKPLKKTENGFEEISWETAISEISDKLKNILEEHGPRSLVHMGGGQGCHFQAAFALGLLKGLGSRYYYSPVAQELTGYFWVCGKMLGRQNLFTITDEEHSDMMLAIGWNGMESHQIPRAPLVLREFAKNPDKLLVVIDPRKSETAKAANIHLAVKPGTDAILTKAMIAIILENGWQNRDYISRYLTGFEIIEPWFKDFDSKGAIGICELAYDDVFSLCKELVRRKWCFHADLGCYYTRHSTVLSYLQMILAAICGRICVPGGNIIPGHFVPLGPHNDENDPRTWRTVATDFPSILGTFPPNVLPEEIMSDHPERPRAVFVSGTNPLRSFADTSAYEAAFKKLDLLVTMEIAMTETAAQSHYVLPARSAYESWDSSFFSFNYPNIFFHMRPPVLKPEGELLECGQIYVKIAKAVGLTPEIPDYLMAASSKGLFEYTLSFLAYLGKNKEAARMAPIILAETLGRRFDSANRAALWGLLLAMSKTSRKRAQNSGFKLKSVLSILTKPGRIKSAIWTAIHHKTIAPLFALSPGIQQSEDIYNTLMEHPEGIWIGKLDLEENMKEVRTQNKKINMLIPELEEWLKSIDPDSESKALIPNQEYPFILNAGKHTRIVANTLMRNPQWLKGKRACTVSIHPEDATTLGLKDGQPARVVTEAGQAEIEVEVTRDVRKGMLIIPHGFGLSYDGQTFGININYLTRGSHRDPIAATPLHRYVPCRIEHI